MAEMNLECHSQGRPFLYYYYYFKLVEQLPFVSLSVFFLQYQKHL